MSDDFKQMISRRLDDLASFGYGDIVPVLREAMFGNASLNWFGMSNVSWARLEQVFLEHNSGDDLDPLPEYFTQLAARYPKIGTVLRNNIDIARCVEEWAVDGRGWSNDITGPMLATLFFDEATTAEADEESSPVYVASLRRLGFEILEACGHQDERVEAEVVQDSNPTYLYSKEDFESVDDAGFAPADLMTILVYESDGSTHELVVKSNRSIDVRESDDISPNREFPIDQEWFDEFYRKSIFMLNDILKSGVDNESNRR